MLSRVAIFIFALLLLPLTGVWLSGNEVVWPEGSGMAFDPMPVAITAGMLLFLLLSIEGGANRQRSLFKLQRRYFFALGATGAVSGWLLLYLNHYTESWLAPGTMSLSAALALTALFTLLLPTVLGLRTALGSLPGLLLRLARLPAIPALPAEPAALLLIPLAMLGLIAGAAWPSTLFWLLWTAPLLLLVGMQLMWHERSIFAELATGVWGRIICVTLSALLVCNLALLTYRLTGGTLIVQLPNFAFTQLAFVLYGLLGLQLGDLVAEFWRGKARADVFKKKAFPIPVVSKKVQ